MVCSQAEVEVLMMKMTDPVARLEVEEAASQAAVEVVSSPSWLKVVYVATTTRYLPRC